MIMIWCGSDLTGQVEWELIEPQSGVVFKTAREGFSGNHMYTTYSHAPMDMDGPRYASLSLH